MRRSIFRLDAPASAWFEGHVLGNGDTGAVVWGGPEEIRVGLSKYDINYFGPVCGKDGWEGTYPELVRQLHAGKRGFLSRYGQRTRSSEPFACGMLSIMVPHDGYRPKFVQELDPVQAECRVRLKMPELYRRTLGQMPPPPILMRMRVLADRNVVEIRLDATERHRVGLLFSPGMFDLPGLGQPEFSVNLLRRSLPEGLGYAIAFSGTRLTPSPIGLAGTADFGGDHGTLLLRMAIAVSGGGDPGAMAGELLGYNADEADCRHRDFWRRFNDRSGVWLEDKALEEYWRFGIYALGCATSPRTMPPHLQGVWNMSRYAAWCGDFHFNTNLQQALWPCGMANHPELLKSCVRTLLFDWREELRNNARLAGLPGLMVPLCADPKGRALCWSLLGMAMGMTAWTALIPLEYLECTGEWRGEIIEFLRECCEFQLAVLEDGDDGLLHVPLSDSPEQVELRPDGTSWHVLGRDPAIDLTLARILFREFAKLVPEDDPVGRQAAAALRRLAPLPVHDGALADYAAGFFESGARPGVFPWSHRHPSRLFPIYPGARWLPGLCPPELARRSLKEFLSHGKRGFTSFTYAWLAAVHARLGMGKGARRMLQTLFDCFMLPGGLMLHGSRNPRYGLRLLELFQFEVTGGTAAAISEMLLQKYGQEVALFHGCPMKRASFRHFAVGEGALVSAKLESGLITEIEIDFQKPGCIRIARSRNFAGGDFFGNAGERTTIRLAGRRFQIHGTGRIDAGRTSPSSGDEPLHDNP